MSAQPGQLSSQLDQLFVQGDQPKDKTTSKQEQVKSPTASSADADHEAASLSSRPSSEIGPARLTDLSPELLVKIVEYVSGSDIADNKPWPTRDFHALCLTCKSLNIVTTPFLYSVIDLRYERFPAVDSLLRTLIHRPALGHNIQRLEIHTKPLNANPLTAIRELEYHERLAESDVEAILSEWRGLRAKLRSDLMEADWDAENGMLLLLVPKVRYLTIIITGEDDLKGPYTDSSMVLRVIHGMLFLRPPKEAFPHLQEVQVLPSRRVEKTRHVDMGWFVMTGLAWPAQLRHLSITGLRQLKKKPYSNIDALSSLTSLEFKNTSIPLPDLCAIVMRCDRLEEICVHWNVDPSNMLLLRYGVRYRPRSSYIFSQALQFHTSSIRKLVLESKTLRSVGGATEWEEVHSGRYFGSLSMFSVLEVLELDEGFIRATPLNQPLNRFKDLSVGLQDFFPDSLKSFTLHPTGRTEVAEHGLNYNLLALVSTYVPERLEHICISSGVLFMEDDHEGLAAASNPAITHRGLLSNPPRRRLNIVDSIPGLRQPYLSIEYYGPNLNDQLDIFRFEWRPRALEIHWRDFRNNDLCW